MPGFFGTAVAAVGLPIIAAYVLPVPQLILAYVLPLVPWFALTVFVAGLLVVWAVRRPRERYVHVGAPPKEVEEVA